MSQTIEMSQCNVRYHQTEVIDLKQKITELEALIAQHKEVGLSAKFISKTRINLLTTTSYYQRDGMLISAHPASLVSRLKIHFLERPMYSRGLSKAIMIR